MIYLALDPGTTTGVAWYDTFTRATGFLEIEGRHELYRYLDTDWGLVPDWSNNRWSTSVGKLIIERWDVREDTRKKTNQDDPRYIIGMVEWACWASGVIYKEQRPVQIKGKTVATDAVLRRLDWYSGGEGHADDAARHLLVALLEDRVPAIVEAVA